jgi:ABC-type nitrate/sulfonate/bicarbonate transport system ATPase subunit
MHRDKKPGEISGGMRQRTAVARAFAVGPKVLLLDEPFGALDALTRSNLQQQLIDMWSKEAETETVVMVTHGIEEAIFLADRIVVMGNPPKPSIAEVIEVDIERPRDRAEIAKDPEFQRVRERLVYLLEHELAIPEATEEAASSQASDHWKSASCSQLRSWCSDRKSFLNSGAAWAAVCASSNSP